MAQWSALEESAASAIDAIGRLEIALLKAMQESDGDADTDNAIVEQLARIADAKAKILPAYFYHPQGEWLGGESFATREPHFMGMRRLTVVEAMP